MVVDPDGRDKQLFDSDGRYKGDEYIIKQEGTHIGQVEGIDGTTGYSFDFADQNDVSRLVKKDSENDLGSAGNHIYGVKLVSNQEIDNILSESGVQNKYNFITRYLYALNESRGIGKKMVYVNSYIIGDASLLLIPDT